MPTASQEVRYRLAPGTDVVTLDGEGLLFRSDAVAVKLEGASADLFLSRVLPLLDGRRTLAEVSALLPEVAPDDLRTHLDALVASRVLRKDHGPRSPEDAWAGRMAPVLNLLDTLGIAPADARRRLSGLRIGVLGLEAHGAHAAKALADCGVGSLALLDPDLCRPAHLTLMPGAGPDAVGRPRHDVVKAAVEASGCSKVAVVGPTVSRQAVDDLAGGCDLLVACFDRAFSAANHWVNAAGLAHGVPAIHAELRGATAVVGPLVVPGETGCYMCWRMRALACDDDFVAAMGYEEFLDGQRRSGLHGRGVLPALAPYVGALVAVEVVKLLLPAGLPTLAGRVQTFDALSGQTERHVVLQVPECPACKKKIGERLHPTLDELLADTTDRGDILAVADLLVSGRCGVVRRLTPVEKGPTEPTLPYLYVAEPANFRYVEGPDPNEDTAMGKGLTPDAARVGALGEAVERYSASVWSPDEVVYARRDDLGGRSLDPRELVLYLPWQYESLHYAPYTDASVLGWVPARSLVTGATVQMPAHAAFITYVPRSRQENLFPGTSNGLAAGATLADAVLAGLLEVLERDAFLITWMHRLPTRRVDPCGHPDRDLVGMVSGYRRRGVELALHRLPTDHPGHVFLAMGRQVGPGDGPAAVVGLGADTDPARAARKALLEVGQIWPGLRAKLREASARERLEELVADPSRVSDLDDHDLLYADRRASGALGFLADRPVESFDWTAPAARGAAQALGALADHFRSSGQEVLWCNLTPPDMADLHLYTVRVVVPDFQPIHFGATEARLAGRRLYELPARLGLATATAKPADLNPDPHPLA